MNKLVPIESLIELAQKTGADKEEWALKMLAGISRTGSPGLIKAFITKLRDRALVEALDAYPLDRFIQVEFHPECFRDNLLLGRIKGTNSPFWYPVRDLTKHLLVLGRPGSGKSNLNYIIAWQTINRASLWIFDRKEDYRHLVRLFPDKIMVFDLLKQFKFNPLSVPPGVHPKKWLEIFSDVFSRSNSLLDGSLGLLVVELDKLYQRYGVYSGSANFPTFFDLLQRLKNLPLNPRSRTEGYRESLVNRLGAYLTSNPDLYNCSTGYPLEELLNRNVVFELHGMLDQQARFWINIMLYWLFCYRIEKKERGNELKNLVIFDEAKSVFTPFHNENIGFPPITYMVAMLREFGVGIIASDQSAQLANAVFACSYCKILFPVGSGEDLAKMQKAMSLTLDRVEYVHKLNQGEGIVRCPGYPKPFVLITPRFPLG
jgi:hypothetical protein